MSHMRQMRQTRRIHLPRRQRGMTLFMALIMLVVLTMLALTSFNLTQANMQVVTNMQQRDAAQFAVRGVMEEIVSGNKFHETSTETLIAQPGCQGTNTRCVDTNGDTVNDVTVKLKATPRCVKAKTIKTANLDMNIKEEQECGNGGNPMTGLVGASTGDSFCADSVWEVQAEAVDDISDAKVTVTQGVSVRVLVDKMKTECPG